jgi:hypothetical protein
MITRKKLDAIDVEVGQRIRIQRLQCAGRDRRNALGRQKPAIAGQSPLAATSLGHTPEAGLYLTGDAGGVRSERTADCSPGRCAKRASSIASSA